MIEPQRYNDLREAIKLQVTEDSHVLDELRREIRLLRSGVRRIQERSVTAISLVGTDGGNNALQFDPFLVQLIRVVDSSNNEYCLEAISPTTRVSDLSKRQFDGGFSPITPLGEMMHFLNIKELTELSHMIRSNEDDRPVSTSWVQVYRELVEWATLFSIVRNKDFGADTLIVFDGLLRSKIFARDLFRRYLNGLQEAIERQYKKNRRSIYLAGVAKHSKVLTRYRLAMALENILTTDYPAYLEIPRHIEEKAYVWNEYARGEDRVGEGGEINKFVGGKMFFVKFGSGKRDPIWPIDIFSYQSDQAQAILGYLLADSTNGFPVPLYPLCLQKAHENAALVEFDFDILQDQIYEALRDALGNESETLDVFTLQDQDPSRNRYS